MDGAGGRGGNYGSKSAIVEAVKACWPEWSPGKVMNSASQLLRFRDEVTVDDRVLTYDSGKRVYHIGAIAGAYRYDARRCMAGNC